VAGGKGAEKGGGQGTDPSFCWTFSRGDLFGDETGNEKIMGKKVVRKNTKKLNRQKPGRGPARVLNLGRGTFGREPDASKRVSPPREMLVGIGRN